MLLNVFFDVTKTICIGQSVVQGMSPDESARATFVVVRGVGSGGAGREPFGMSRLHFSRIRKRKLAERTPRTAAHGVFGHRVTGANPSGSKSQDRTEREKNEARPL